MTTSASVSVGPVCEGGVGEVMGLARSVGAVTGNYSEHESVTCPNAALRGLGGSVYEGRRKARLQLLLDT